ncbi:hypothetical protein DIURU_004259 [Diutina rugosa]|uniref:Uncharacterized protein n=1 Tax=Diutina rugosa TaxID=5481 RepID=A0A642UKG3_DIURU|nr:uncharacterized protein DIURU_004259 [Diutina rugosa]KAA8899592.1 hypothetical protein DIURU_004259 [Diutina rugosa]
MLHWWLSLTLWIALACGLEHHYQDSSQFKSWLQQLETTDTVEVVHSTLPPTSTNATFLVLCQNSDVYDMLETIHNFQERFPYAYDWTFLNDEPFTKDFIYLVGSRFSAGRISFGTIPKEHWGWPEHIDVDLAHLSFEQLSGFPYGSSESYRHMCRWFSGFFYHHPLLSRYQYYWRVEPDVRLTCDIPRDLFKYMADHDVWYGYALTIFEYRETIRSLWSTFKEFLATEPAVENNLPLLPMVQNDDEYQSYNLCHFWNNFEIANLDLFRNDKYQRLFDHLDQSGGFYYERWGDAPIHTLAVVLALNQSQVHWFDEIGYSHRPYHQCPQNDHKWIQNRCVCDPDDDFSFGSYSCTPHFLKVTGQKVDFGE